MTSPIGIAHCISRLRQCPDLTALARVWSGLGKEYQHNEEVAAMKNKMKEALSNG